MAKLILFFVNGSQSAQIDDSKNNPTKKGEVIIPDVLHSYMKTDKL